jgi:hypothetical protein
MMSKARLRLIRCSGSIQPQARDRKREDGFQWTVIDGGGRAVGAERADPWDAVFEMFESALLVGEAIYAAILAASVTTLELQGSADPEQIS